MLAPPRRVCRLSSTPRAQGARLRNSKPQRPKALPMRSEERRVGKEGRSRCDGTADVCSSDPDVGSASTRLPPVFDAARAGRTLEELKASAPESIADEIGRASCRERG